MKIDKELDEEFTKFIIENDKEFTRIVNKALALIHEEVSKKDWKESLKAVAEGMIAEGVWLTVDRSYGFSKLKVEDDNNNLSPMYM